MDTKATAYAIALLAHTGQFDKAGMAYMNHVERVASKFQKPEQIQAALLHDVLEDSSITLTDMERFGISKEVRDAVRAMTKRAGEPYNTYLARVKANPIACAVKLEDLRDNANVNRIKCPTADDFRRTAKYMDAIAYLLED